MILANASLGTDSSALTVCVPSLSVSKGFPGSMPIVAIFSSIGLSASAGGLSFSRVASRSKYALVLRLLTCSRTGVVMSMLGSTWPAAGVYGLPYELSGTSEIASCSVCTAA
ncbi:Uncharacterised protein [Mycobacteroides abscessus subsp. abscessus]|nr:Uncharacterised protein [Mycobacteroides abscessus subsp. abscessus]